MRFLRLAVFCCLLSMAAGFPLNARTTGNTGKCRVPDVETAYKNSKAVFVGKVLSVASDGDVKTFTFKVERYWKGAATKKIKVSVQETMRYQAWFEIGETYLVYARGDEDNKRLWEVRCSRTKSLADASEDTAKLGWVKKPTGK